jgi:hypothetical protein
VSFSNAGEELIGTYFIAVRTNKIPRDRDENKGKSRDGKE